MIVLNYDGENFIEKLLLSLGGQTFRDFEIVFVDNASKDRSVEILRKLLNRGRFRGIQMKLVLNRENFGYCMGNNIGLAHAEGSYIVFLNNDTYVSPKWLEELVKVLDTHPSVGVCQSKIVSARTGKIQTIGNIFDGFFCLSVGSPCGYDLVKLAREGVLVNGFFYPSGCSAIFRREVLDESGCFDEDLFCGDYDLGWRIRMLGYDIATSLRSVCYHFGSQSVRKIYSSTAESYHGYRETIYVLFKNYSFSRIVKRGPISLALFLCESIYLTLRFKEPRIFMFIMAVFWNLRNFRNLLEKRRKVQQTRSVSDDEIEKHMFPYPLFVYSVKEKMISILERCARIRE